MAARSDPPGRPESIHSGGRHVRPRAHRIAPALLAPVRALCLLGLRDDRRLTPITPETTSTTSLPDDTGLQRPPVEGPEPSPELLAIYHLWYGTPERGGGNRNRPRAG